MFYVKWSSFVSLFYILNLKQGNKNRNYDLICIITILYFVVCRDIEFGTGSTHKKQLNMCLTNVHTLY